ncbi:hypothetical protein Tco_1266020 [Tanacetum coccineum]
MFMCHIIGVEPLFKNIITDGAYVPLVAGGLRKHEAQWSDNERKAANLDQHLKSLIMSVLSDDQMNSDFQDKYDDEKDTRSSEEYMNDLEMKFHEKALLAKSKRFFKNDPQRLELGLIARQALTI